VLETERILALDQFRHRGQRGFGAATVHDDAQGLAGAVHHQPLHVRESLDPAPIDREHEIPVLEAGGFRGAAGLDLVDESGSARLAVEDEHGREQDDREDEIGDRARRDDGGPLGNVLVREADLAFGLVHGGERRLVRHARGVLVAEEFHIAAQRDGGELPTGAVAVREADELAAEADREHQDPHAAPACDHEVPELVEEHHDRQDEQERNDPVEEPVSPRPDARKKIHQYLVPRTQPALPKIN
jgi:hypothetical protein